MLDLSVTGSRVRTDENFTAGIYMRVETEFQLEGSAVAALAALFSPSTIATLWGFASSI